MKSPEKTFQKKFEWKRTPIQICGALRDLVAFVQLKTREKHPWRSVNFSKVAGCNTPNMLFDTSK